MPERHVRIAATGRYLPGQVLTNEELVARFARELDELDLGAWRPTL